ncbi:Thioredoxin-like 3-2, chloroplastic [Apostasia shenzhenica]|uniref:Thioredoxin-like 3-2, chloroplastic n=1 Tax=Apostasia shenzhenica TaxID=1088818 RepID=A0A2I0ATA4_9ASPA|nr:Thioredoxin-like 3-2, chloroplastic [Apostasia shenzhenica]
MANALPSASLPQPNRSLPQISSPQIADRGSFHLLRLHHRLDPAMLPPVSASFVSVPIPSAPQTRRTGVALAFSSGLEETRLPDGQLDDDALESIELLNIASEEQFDCIISEAQQLGDSLIIIWMANWCRKCIYLKPKLEKLAAHYYPRIHFYCVDVNSVPQRLVTRAEISLWKDSQRKAELIGGHKAWLVVNDVRKMIENED